MLTQVLFNMDKIGGLVQTLENARKAKCSNE